MSTIEDNSATPSVPSSVSARIESSKYGEEEKSRNMINVPLAHEKSTLEHMSNNVPCADKMLHVLDRKKCNAMLNPSMREQALFLSRICPRGQTFVLAIYY